MNAVPKSLNASELTKKVLVAAPNWLVNLVAYILVPIVIYFVYETVSRSNRYEEELFKLLHEKNQLQESVEELKRDLGTEVSRNYWKNH